MTRQTVIYTNDGLFDAGWKPITHEEMRKMADKGRHD